MNVPRGGQSQDEKIRVSSVTKGARSGAKDAFLEDPHTLRQEEYSPGRHKSIITENGLVGMFPVLPQYHQIFRRGLFLNISLTKHRACLAFFMAMRVI